MLFIQQRTQFLDGIVYLFEVVEQVHVEGVLRFLIELFAVCELFHDELLHLLRRLVEQQGAHGASHLEVFVEHFWRSLQINHLDRKSVV